MHARILTALLFLATGCASDLSGEGLDDQKEGTGDGDGSGGGNGDGSGDGKGSVDELCALGSLSSATWEGGFETGEVPYAEAAIFAESGDDFHGVIVSVAQTGGVTLGPGSYPLTEANSFADCNPCVVALGFDSAANAALESLAISGTLTIDTLSPQAGGTMSGSIAGVQMAGVDDTTGSVSSCRHSIPDMSFDVTLEEFSEDKDS